MRVRMANDAQATSTELVTITTKMNFGPAMTALTPKQRAFVMSYNNAGGKNATEAGRCAGFSDSPNLRSFVSALLRDPRIQAAVREDIAARFTEDLIETKSAIDKIAKNETHPKQFNALMAKLHHGGLYEKTVVENNVNVTLTFEQKVDQLRHLAALVGEDQNAVLKGIIDVTPAEVIEEPTEW